MKPEWRVHRVYLVLHKLDRDYDQAVFTSDHNPFTYTMTVEEWVGLGRPVDLTITAESGRGKENPHQSGDGGEQ